MIQRIENHPNKLYRLREELKGLLQQRHVLEGQIGAVKEKIQQAQGGPVLKLYEG